MSIETNGVPMGGAGTPPAGAPLTTRSARAARRARWRSMSLKVGLTILVAYLLVAVISLFWTPKDPFALGVGPSFAPPSSQYWLGTDRLGSDQFSRIMVATRLDLTIIVVAVFFGMVIGTFLGVVAGFFGGAGDVTIMRLVEVFQSFPTLLFGMLVVQAIGPGTTNVILVLSLVGIPAYLRLARADVMSKRNWQFAEAAVMVGNRSWRVAFRHLLPNSMNSVLAYTSVNAAWVAILTATLGFLGLGIPPSKPEWGSMVARGQDAIMTGQWWVSFFPGVAIVGVAGAFYLVGDGLAEILDPKSDLR